MHRSPHALFIALLLLSVLSSVAAAEPVEPPPYQAAGLDYLYPAGGCRGTSVAVTLGGAAVNGASDLHVIVDGPPGISAGPVERKAGVTQVVLEIAADAKPGRRWIRLAGGPAGLSNACPFFIGTLPEHIEGRQNNTPEQAEPVSLPVVINARIERVLDVDCFRFEGRAGQRVTAAVVAHRLDSKRRAGTRDYGYADASLEIIDSQGRILADAEDVVGLDPVIQVTLPADGAYIARVKLLDFKGSPEAVYRLTLGDVPHATALFPAGGRRGDVVRFDFTGPGCDAALARHATLPGDPEVEVVWLSPDAPQTDGFDLPCLLSDPNEYAEVLEVEPNDSPAEAPLLTLPVVVNARFAADRDRDCYRVALKKGDAIHIETLAQRVLASPVDTLVEVLDADGRVVAQNDDGQRFQGWCAHDFAPFDSELDFQAKQDGEYTIRVIEQKGVADADAVYRLTVEPQRSNFQLYQWPDAIPVWGAGSTASFIVELERWGPIKGDIELLVQGLPEGWRASPVVMHAADYVPQRTGTLVTKAAVTITAPADAPAGTILPIRVLGRLATEEGELVRAARPLGMYQEFGHQFRISPQSRVVLAPRSGPWLETDVRELEAAPGDKVKIPVRVVYPPGEEKTQVSLVINRTAAHHLCGIGAPITLPPGATEYEVPVTIPAGTKGDTLQLLIARGWRSDVRAGLPGPCTPLITVKLKSAE